ESGPVRVTVAGAARPGERVLVGLRPEDLTLVAPGASGPTSAQNHLPGRIVRVTPLGALWRVAIEAGVPLTALVTRPAVASLGLAPGVLVEVTFKATAVHLVRRGEDCAEPSPGLGRRHGGLGGDRRRLR